MASGVKGKDLLVSALAGLRRKARAFSAPLSCIRRGRAAHLKLGRRGEAIARDLLKSKHYTLLASDLRNPAGELDIVALDGETLVFVEVKTLRRSGPFRPSDNLSLRQFKRNVAAARYFMRSKSLELPCRFDIVEVVGGGFFPESVEHRSGIWYERRSKWLR